mmetsp:Transcript_13898/g.18963  ORF Transcript_13898/g.18963 Transcript_13898/m.18963 type:complete len:125 (-) Transcript_13898:1414-1788(-)
MTRETQIGSTSVGCNDNLRKSTIQQTSNEITKNLNTSTINSCFESYSPSKLRQNLHQTNTLASVSSTRRSKEKSQNERLPTRMLVRKVLGRKAKTRLEKIQAKYDPAAAAQSIDPKSAHTYYTH